MNRSEETSRRAAILCGCGALLAAVVVVAAAGIRGRTTRTNPTAKPSDDAIEAALVKTDRVLNATALVGETARALLEGPSEANTPSP